MKTQEDYKEEMDILRNKCINIIDNQPTNRQELHRFLCRMTYIRGIIRGFELAKKDNSEVKDGDTSGKD